MKILVVSDSHRDDDTILKLAKEYPNMDLYLHAGDSESNEYDIYPFISIRGNCDFYDFDNKRLFKTEYGNILMKHHPFLFKDEENELFIFIHGHTHRHEVKKEGKYIILCPGSISFSRDRNNGSYAIITLEKDNKSIDIIELFTKTILTHYKIM